MIDYHTNYNHPRTIVKQKYALIEQFKDFKRSIIACHLQNIVNNPSDKDLKRIPPLYKLLQNQKISNTL